jgi:hypothetical protein
METKKEMDHYLIHLFLLNRQNLKEIQVIGKKQLHYFNKRINLKRRLKFLEKDKI